MREIAICGHELVAEERLATSGFESSDDETHTRPSAAGARARRRSSEGLAPRARRGRCSRSCQIGTHFDGIQISARVWLGAPWELGAIEERARDRDSGPSSLSLAPSICPLPRSTPARSVFRPRVALETVCADCWADRSSTPVATPLSRSTSTRPKVRGHCSEGGAESASCTRDPLILITNRGGFCTALNCDRA